MKSLQEIKKLDKGEFKNFANGSSTLSCFMFD